MIFCRRPAGGYDPDLTSGYILCNPPGAHKSIQYVNNAARAVLVTLSRASILQLGPHQSGFVLLTL